MSSTTHESTRVGSPPTPFSPSGTRFSTSSKRYRESTHLIPTPGTDKNGPKRYDLCTYGCRWSSALR
ncbi:hypothetical protein B0H17DRAFT_170770 [Mycena rosella]|uniref:Uncharacterized protein n=1 Tax=Mycena rosella TaxID=1033263 RepID=A0AAD7G6V2_MYCRO|nr:hypothetical protein B0H17DRAFT_170770 [Mycena rosella]